MTDKAITVDPSPLPNFQRKFITLVADLNIIASITKGFVANDSIGR